MKKGAKPGSGTGRKVLGFFLLIIILAAAASVFYFGYYQFQLPADTYGVYYTRLNGWNGSVVSPAEFRIEWEGLIPLNLTLHRFRLEPVISDVSAAGVLPSADEYSSFLEGSPDFSYEISLHLVYRLNPESLPDLVTEEFLREDNIDSFYDEFESDLLANAAAFIRRKSTDESYMKNISFNYSLMEKDLISELSGRYSFVDFIKVTPETVKIPDMFLYAEGRRLYYSMTDYNERLRMESQEKTTSRLVEEASKIDLLEKYGEVFTRYPILIDYYSLFREDGAALLPSIEMPDITD